MGSASTTIGGEEIGWGYAKLFEPDPLSVVREYRIEWKKQLPIAELARMRWGEGLSFNAIAQKTGISVGALHENLSKLSLEERKRYLR